MAQFLSTWYTFQCDGTSLLAVFPVAGKIKIVMALLSFSQNETVFILKLLLFMYMHHGDFPPWYLYVYEGRSCGAYHGTWHRIPLWHLWKWNDCIKLGMGVRRIQRKSAEMKINARESRGVFKEIWSELLKLNNFRLVQVGNNILWLEWDY